MQNKEILLVTSRLDVGGVAKSICVLANELCSRGYKLGILSFSNAASRYKLNEGIKIYYLSGPDFIRKSTSPIWRKMLSIALNVRLFIFLLTQRDKFLIVFRTDLIVLFSRYCHILGISMLGSERGNPYRFSDSQLLDIISSYNRCTGIVFQTEESKKYMSSRGLSCLQFVIPNYCLCPTENISVNNRNNRIIACGVPSDDKGFDILISAFAVVVNKYPDYSLHIYGPKNDYCQKLLELIAKLNLNSKVMLMGQCDKFFIEEANAAMYVLSSRNEGIPNTLMEAMCVGIPSIATNCSSGGPSLLTNSGERGILVPVNDIQGLANAMIYYIENPNVAAQFGERGRQVKTVFAPNIITERWVEIIDSYA